ncbi:hypothetical protein PMZ80_004249 [Knufia obscura]|uniref:Uncharacterized protein n=1 Tax=Knufia obscura TaxID=1635080 RepID=A0ABR0RRL1_9EURO|nr:hypothetical protein PMZ80_004249 [Knufia obscura]
MGNSTSTNPRASGRTHEYPYESSGSRMRRIDYGRMEHDIGYATSKPRSTSHSHSRTKRSNSTKDHTHTKYAHSNDLFTRDPLPPIHQPVRSANPYGHPVKGYPRSSSRYEPERPSKPRTRSISRAGSIRSPATINPAEYYADCIGRGNPYSMSMSMSVHDPARRRSGSAPHDRAGVRKCNVADSSNAKVGSKARKASRTESAWTYDWPSMSMSVISRSGSRGGSRRY